MIILHYDYPNGALTMERVQGNQNYLRHVSVHVDGNL